MKGGFTLLELLIVLALISLASAVTVPRLLDSSPDELTRASDATVAVLNDVRLRAARSGVVHRFTLDPGTGRYWVEDASARLVFADTLDLPQGVSISSSKARLHFRFTPTAEASADTIVLLSGDGVRSITADGWTGDVRAR